MAFDFNFSDLFDNAGETFFGVIERWAVQADQWLNDAFSSSAVDDSWWAAVVGTPSQLGVLQLWMPILAPIVVLLVTAQVVLSVIRGSSVGVARGAVGAFLGLPVTFVMVWVVKAATAASDEASAYIMDSGSETNMNVFMKIFGIEITDGKLSGMNESYWMWDGVMDKAGGWVLLVPMVLMALIWLLSIILAFVMSLRAMGLIILASLAGWAVVSMTLEVTKSWFAGWLKIVVGLLLAKPFAAALIVMSGRVFLYSDSGLQFAAGLAGLIIAIAMPFVAISFVSFTPASAVREQDQALNTGLSRPTRAVTRSLSRFK